MSKTLEQQLKDLQSHDQLNPDHVWVSNTRERLHLELRAPKRTKKASWFDYLGAMQLLVPQVVLSATRSLAMFVLVVAVALGGWGASVSASQKSMPGDLLYVVKLAHEKQEVRNAETGKDRVEILLKHASTRVGELEQLQDGKAKKKLSPEKKKKHTETVLASLKEKIETSNETLEKARQENDDETIAVAKAIEEGTDRIEEQLRSSVDAVNEPGVDINVDDELAIAGVADLVEGANVKAIVATVETILEGHDSGIFDEESTAALEEATEKVAKKLQGLGKTLEGIRGDAGGVGYQVGVVSPTGTVSTTKSITEQGDGDLLAQDVLVSTATGTEVIVEGDIDGNVSENVTESVEAVEKELKEINDLLEGDNVLEAIEKVEALFTSKNDVKEKVQDAQKIADTGEESVEGVEESVVSEEVLQQQRADTTKEVGAPLTDQQSSITIGTE